VEEAMRLERHSPRTGAINAMEIPITEAEYWKAVAAYKKGKLIQDAFPTLNADQREFVKTGYTPEDWKAMFGPDDDGVEPDINDVLP
jgi:hypothetical protein